MCVFLSNQVQVLSFQTLSHLILKTLTLILDCFQQSYFRDGWNTFDFITVVGSIVDALMMEFEVSHAQMLTAIKEVEAPPLNAVPSMRNTE